MNPPHVTKFGVLLALTFLLIVVAVALGATACGDTDGTATAATPVPPAPLAVTSVSPTALAEHRLSAPERRALAVAPMVPSQNVSDPEIAGYIVEVRSLGFALGVYVDAETGKARVPTDWVLGYPVTGDLEKIPPAGEAERWAARVARAAVADWLRDVRVPGLKGLPEGLLTSRGVLYYVVTWGWGTKCYVVTNDGEYCASGDWVRDPRW